MLTNRPNGAVLTQQKLPGWALRVDNQYSRLQQESKVGAKSVCSQRVRAAVKAIARLSQSYREAIARRAPAAPLRPRRPQGAPCYFGLIPSARLTQKSGRRGALSALHRSPSSFSLRCAQPSAAPERPLQPRARPRRPAGGSATSGQ